ncbi:MAG: UDP-glucose 6-dehydrogenase, partial [Kordiimonadaceae bacterium]|nr:UDP-glucose 6-dehydrogenase [Kordiimonadaceae bacterium]
SCFPKDTRALVHSADTYGVPMRIVRSVVDVNEKRKIAMAEKVITACGGSVEGKRIAVLGLTFKPNTDDMRESPSLDIIPALQKYGAVVHAHDPKGMSEAKEMLEDVAFYDDPYGPLKDADALVIITEWNQFRALDLKRVHALMNNPVLVDFRNIYSKADMAAEGFDYSGIGRGK